MNRKPCKTKPIPKTLTRETFDTTKKFFHNAFINLKCLFLRRCHNLPKSPPANLIFSLDKINSKLQELDHFYRSFSKKQNEDEVPKKNEEFLCPKEQTKEDEQCSTTSSVSVGGYIGSEDLKEQKNVSKCSEKKREDSSFMAAEALAQKMKELDMMDVNDLDHVLDIAEVLHYYSRLTCPAYQEMVNKFFVNMHSEFSLPQLSRSRNSSMRKVVPESAHSSMRSLGPIKI